ncbi:hypothetical protein M378DRAFT_12776 [Amanita muscaria Koide BX008]|uniref:DNA polymerase kappa n=1 Tax=Amanita muscaria (strain Koide BX008) TaxID=946122 RepID=A0A0C2T7K9_AMAMK|nr:hypothetical protein M378DRAFT_12776 [Amanita muscaria Koide BX008]
MTEPSQETDSLVKRLAGPSTGKAGLAKDQTEINRIIAEASKGSKFYENEKRKDKELTEHIQRILKQRDEIMKDADIKKVEVLAEHKLAKLEAQRDLTQTVVHVDMDAFFANVELLFNPDLEGKPFGVGRGVLSTASYEARKYGVRSGMPAFIAKKLCPELILISIHFSRYTEMSGKVMSIFKTYDPNMAVAGCDEGYLNITAYCQEHGITADECISEMRQKVFEETKLTVSAGIAANKMLAKICSDKNKPNGQFHLPFDAKSITEFMRELPIRKIPGVGRVNERLLDSIGIKTCGDIFTHRATVYLMDKQFGTNFLLRTYLGIASNVVMPHQREERKSIGSERTFTPLDDKQKILEKLQEIAQELEDDMESNGWTGRTVTLKYKLDTYQVFTRAKSTNKWVKKKEELFTIGKELLMPEFPLRLRLIGLRVTKLKDLKATNNTGIKRFFEATDNSPRKRVKIEESQPPEVIEVGDSDEELAGCAESMPGYHENDERDLDPSQHDQDEEVDYSKVVAESPAKAPEPHATDVSRPTKLRPPVSAPARSTHQTTGQVTVGASSSLATRRGAQQQVIKPTSAVGAASSSIRPVSKVPKSQNKPRLVGEEPLVCPICNKAIHTNNQGLNAHIDFCLSRVSIREAQAETIRPVKKAKR